MRVHLDAIPPGTGATEALFSHPYLSYWYGGMYVVIEGWQRLGLHDPEVDDLLTSDNVKHLERHRHGAFHYHHEYFDDKFLAMLGAPDSPKWIRDLRNALSRWFLDYLGVPPEQRGAPLPTDLD
jgi:hypothetical protein